jgi:hypothetical protein
MVLEISSLNPNRCNLLKNKKIIVYSYPTFTPKKELHVKKVLNHKLIIHLSLSA